MDAHLTEDELSKRLITASQLTKIGATYRHYKGGMYTVKDLAIIEENNEVGVIYQAQYGQKLTFIRPFSVWHEEVDNDGVSVPRFAVVEL